MNEAALAVTDARRPFLGAAEGEDAARATVPLKSSRR
jgi:hypothetical protein